MFDIGFWELILIGVIALVVFGPERLPAIATRIGHWVGRGRALMRAVQMQLEQELEASKTSITASSAPTRPTEPAREEAADKAQDASAAPESGDAPEDKS